MTDLSVTQSLSVTAEEEAARNEKGKAPSQGKKYDTGKPMMDLMPPLMEVEVARVLTFGAEKYGPENWRGLDNLRSRYIAAAKRHINAMQQGYALDEESGLHHAAHAVCCLMFLGEVDLGG